MVDRLPVELHVGDTQVHIRRKPPVECYFALAVFVASLPLPEVEKPKLDMLPELVHPILDENQG